MIKVIKPKNTEKSIAKVMSGEAVKALTIDDQIEKLRTLIEDHSSVPLPVKENDNQWKRTEKLQHKLRYLEFFQSYAVDACPE